MSTGGNDEGRKREIMARRKINSTAPPYNEAAQLLVPTEPSVPGVKLELGILLIQAIKARRKLLSKTSSLSSSTADDGNNNIQSRELLQTLQDNVSDKTTAFLNELKRSVQNKSSWSSSASSVSYKRTNSTTTYTTHAPVRCFEFLLDILSNNNDGTNTSSFHLRRSALAISHEILTRSRDARSFFARGQCLLDFVRMIEGVEYEQVMAVVGEDEIDRDDNDGGRSRGQLSPRALFQLEAIELIHELSIKYGNLYTEFMVSSRLLGDISTNFTMQHHHFNNLHEDCGNAAPENAESGTASSQQQQRANNNARSLRTERNVALEYGSRACQILERMVERADVYFRILVPRFGGFNTSIESNHKRDTDNDTGDDDDDVDDGSIDWEEGDFELLIDDAEHNIDGIVNDHQTAVSQTLAVMERSGALLEGALAIQVHGDKAEADVNLPATGQDHVPDDVSARKKLHNLIVKLSHRLFCINQWIFALSHADGMDERTVIDPITARPLISLVLLSEEKRAVRSMLLQRMMKVRGEIECVLCSASKLGIVEKESRSKVRAIESEGISAAVNTIAANDTLAGIKRPSLPPISKRKRTKIPRINFIYRKK